MGESKRGGSDLTAAPGSIGASSWEKGVSVRRKRATVGMGLRVWAKVGSLGGIVVCSRSCGVR